MPIQSPKNTRLIGVTMSKELHDKVEDVATKLKTSKSDVVRAALKFVLSKYEIGEKFPRSEN